MKTDLACFWWDFGVCWSFEIAYEKVGSRHRKNILQVCRQVSDHAPRLCNTDFRNSFYIAVRSCPVPGQHRTQPLFLKKIDNHPQNQLGWHWEWLSILLCNFWDFITCKNQFGHIFNSSFSGITCPILPLYTKYKYL